MDGQGRARRWQQKAEECRAVSEQVKNPMARDSFRHMAEIYDGLARQCEEQAGRDSPKKPEAG